MHSLLPTAPLSHKRETEKMHSLFVTAASNIHHGHHRHKKSRTARYKEDLLQIYNQPPVIHAPKYKPRHGTRDGDWDAPFPSSSASVSPSSSSSSLLRHNAAHSFHQGISSLTKSIATSPMSEPEGYRGKSHYRLYPDDNDDDDDINNDGYYSKSRSHHGESSSSINHGKRYLTIPSPSHARSESSRSRSPSISSQSPAYNHSNSHSPFHHSPRSSYTSLPHTPPPPPRSSITHRRHAPYQSSPYQSHPSLALDLDPDLAWEDHYHHHYYTPRYAVSTPRSHASRMPATTTTSRYTGSSSGKGRSHPALSPRL